MRRSTIAPAILATLTLFTLNACDSGAFDAPPTRPAAVAPSELSGPQVVGHTLDPVTITVTDWQGHPLAGEQVTWLPSAGTVDAVTEVTDSAGRATATWTLGTTAGTQTLSAHVRDLQAIFAADAAPDRVVGLEVVPPGAPIAAIGDTVPLDWNGLDEYGNRIPRPGRPAWTSSRIAVATVDSGAIVARGAGSTVVVARLDWMVDSATVTVAPTVRGLAFARDTAAMVPGDTRTFLPVAIDARGSAVDSALDLTWSSSDEAVATVTGDGAITAHAVGTATVTATATPSATAGADAAALFAELTVIVKAGPRPTIAAVAPATLVPGETATLSGTGFSPELGANRVTVNGAVARVLEATPSELTVEVPAPAELGCFPTGDRPVSVAVAGLEAETSHPVRGAEPRSLAVGESATFFDEATACLALAEPGEYVLSVSNAARNPYAYTPFQLRGARDGAPDDAPLRELSFPGRPSAPLMAQGRPAERDPRTGAHGAITERNLHVAERIAPYVAEAVAAAPSIQWEVELPEVGDLRTFRFGSIDDYTCNEYELVTARAVYVGERAIVWEDTAAPLAQQTDSLYRRLGQEFDDVMFPILTSTFGNPFALDAALDGDGRVAMLFTPSVNKTPNLAGFASTSDLGPRDVCRSSNLGETFYGMVPEAGTHPVDGWWRYIRSTALHESVHVTQFATMLRNGTSIETMISQGPIAEALAVLGQEHYARASYGYTDIANVGFDDGLDCELASAMYMAPCADLPEGLLTIFSWMNGYLRDFPLRSIISGVRDDVTNYASSWLFLRWAIDQSGRSDADFAHELIAETQLDGFGTMEARTGRPYRQLLADFTLALAVDDHPSGVNPVRDALTLPSWNLRDATGGIFDAVSRVGLARSFDLTEPWPLPVFPVDGDFAAHVSAVRAGSAVLLQLSAPHGGQVLELLDATGEPAPAELGVNLVRIH